MMYGGYINNGSIQPVDVGRSVRHSMRTPSKINIKLAQLALSNGPLYLHTLHIAHGIQAKYGEHVEKRDLMIMALEALEYSRIQRETASLKQVLAL